MKELAINYRIWIEVKEDLPENIPRKGRKRKETTRFICGKGVALLLQAILETGSLTEARNKIGYSYKYAWDRTKKIEERLGEPAVETMKGGKGGGGGMRLSPAGEKILSMYKDWDDFFRKCIEHRKEIEDSGILS